MATCNECNGACCKEICVGIDEPKTIDDWDEIRWMVAHENIAVYVDEEGEKLRFNTIEEVEAHIEKVVKPKFQKDLEGWNF